MKRPINWQDLMWIIVGLNALSLIGIYLSKNKKIKSNLKRNKIIGNQSNSEKDRGISSKPDSGKDKAISNKPDLGKDGTISNKSNLEEKKNINNVNCNNKLNTFNQAA
ncbi:hypothetical protein [Lactobacillus kitasatonis]|uniref:hypothetical protein n=1 Tax=Lactobacillus kitasatonis TaxID=237446 RepID=UPI003F671DBE